MKLFFSPNPNYIHKALVTAHEAGVIDRLKFEPVYPYGENTELWKHNPLAKVPCLETDDGEMLYGGLVVCQFLASLAPDRGLFPDDARRWTVLRQMVLGDGLFDAVVDMQLESIKPKEEWRVEGLQRMRRKIIGAFDQLERDARTFRPGEFNLAHICMAGGISYFASPGPPHITPKPNRIVVCRLEPGDETYDWRTGHPALSAWYDETLKRPSMNSAAAHEAIGARSRTAAEYAAKPDTIIGKSWR